MIAVKYPLSARFGERIRVGERDERRDLEVAAAGRDERDAAVLLLVASTREVARRRRRTRTRRIERSAGRLPPRPPGRARGGSRRSPPAPSGVAGTARRNCRGRRPESARAPVGMDGARNVEVRRPGRGQARPDDRERADQAVRAGGRPTPVGRRDRHRMRAEGQCREPDRDIGERRGGDRPALEPERRRGRGIVTRAPDGRAVPNARATIVGRSVRRYSGASEASTKNGSPTATTVDPVPASILLVNAVPRMRHEVRSSERRNDAEARPSAPVGDGLEQQGIAKLVAEVVAAAARRVATSGVTGGRRAMGCVPAQDARVDRGVDVGQRVVELGAADDEQLLVDRPQDHARGDRLAGRVGRPHPDRHLVAGAVAPLVRRQLDVDLRRSGTWNQGNSRPTCRHCR